MKFKNESYLQSLRRQRQVNEIYQSENTRTTDEAVDLSRWTNDRVLQTQIHLAPTYIEKISLINRFAETGLDQNRIDPKKFSGPTKVFDGATGLTTETPIDTTRKDKDGKIQKVQIGNYEELVERDLKVITERKASFGERDIFKSYSEAMEHIFTFLGNEIFGEGFQVLASSEVDDLQNAADLVVVKKDAKGEIENVFSIDLYSDDKSGTKFLKRKLYEGLSRAKNGFLTSVNYVEVGGNRFSAKNVENFIIPMNLQNIERIAESYFKGKYDQELLRDFKQHILENIGWQIALKQRLAEKIEPIIVWKKVEGKKKKEQVEISNRAAKLACLKRVADIFPKTTTDAVQYGDTSLSLFQKMLESFEKNFASTVKKVDRYASKKRQEIAKRKNTNDKK